MKHLFLVTLLCGLTSRLWASSSELMDGVAAIVNDKVITYSEVVKYAQPAVQQLRRDYSGDTLRDKIRAAQMDALNNLIDRALIVNEYNDKGYKLPDNIVDTQIDEVIATDFGGDRTAFIKTLEAEGLTMSSYRDRMRERIIVQAMRNRKMQQEVVVSPADLEKYYQAHLDDYKEEDQIKLRMIYLKLGEKPAPPAPVEPPAAPAGPAAAAATEKAPEPSAEPQPAEPASAAAEKATEPAPAPPVVAEKAAEPAPAAPDAVAKPAEPPPAPWVDPQRKMAEELLAKLKEGDSFESLAKVYSQARESEKGGDWGWITRDTLQKSLSEVAFKLKPNEHSDVIETSEGYYILFVEDFKPARTKPLDEVRAELEKLLLQEQRTKVQEAWVKQLREKAYIRLF